MNNAIHMTVLGDDNVYLIAFDRPQSGANILDVATLKELDDVLKRISGDSGARGVIFASLKHSVFIAGADINELAAVRSPDELREIVKLGQQVMNRIAGLPGVTVAAIHGACLGGGCELALACDYRLASPERATQIGLPETSLGILPCWGGTTRLPRLIGIHPALDLVMNGKKLAPVPAKKLGLVDQVIPREHLQRFALEYIAKGKRAPRPRAGEHNPLALRLTAQKARALALKKTRGHYPAVTTALDVMVKGLGQSVSQSLELELAAVLELSQTPACRYLIRLFQWQDRAKKLGGAKSTPVRRIAVIGAGVMGSGIAHWASVRGLSVVLRDVSAGRVSGGLAAAASLFAEGVRRRLFDRTGAQQGMDRILPAVGNGPLGQVDAIIEAAVEEPKTKQAIFSQLARQAGVTTLLASNTSALSISDLADATDCPGRVVGIHFFNPVHRMQLVEVVAGARSESTSVDRAVRLVQQLGKFPVVVRDSPGFVVNRVLMPYLVEAGLLFEQGSALADLDEAMLSFGMPMGPMRLLDEVGIDVALHVATELAAAYRHLKVPATLSQMVNEGQLGRKTGRGFYVYNGARGISPNPALRPGAGARVHPDELQRRMVLVMINESARCLQEKVVDRPDDIDFALIMGTGFAPFRGGPLTYADQQGIGQIQEELARRAQDDPRFTPCELLSRMAVEGRMFYPASPSSS